MQNYLIHSHLGLGDQIVCNGLIRQICNSYNGYGSKFFVVSKPNNYETVKFMYLDLPNVEVVRLKIGSVIEPESLGEIEQIAKEKNLITIRIGHEHYKNTVPFDRGFYNQFGLDFNTRWTHFKVVRDLASERKLYDHFNIKEPHP